jgi:hypothetical protein
MAGQTLLRFTSQPGIANLFGGNRNLIQGVPVGADGVHYDDVTQPFAINPAQMSQVDSISVNPLADYTITGGSPIIAPLAMPNSGFGGQEVVLVNSSTTFGFSIITESFLPNTGFVLPYGYLNFGPQLKVRMRLVAGKWQPVGVVDDLQQTGLAAHAGGGQGSAVTCDSRSVVFGTVATAGDSAKLRPYATITAPQWITNGGANPMNLFPNAGGQLGTLGVNAALSIPVGQTVWVRNRGGDQYDYALGFDSPVPGTATASKALVLDSSKGVSTFRQTGLRVFTQTAPAAKTTSTTLTAAEIIAGLLTGNQGAAGGATYTMPLGTDLETALLALVPGLAANDAFEFTVVNISTVAAEVITLAGNTGMTAVGDMTIAAIAAGDESSATFRVVRASANTYSFYRTS